MNKERLKKIISEIETISRQLGYWDGNMMMCYIANPKAWNLVRVGDPKERLELGKRLGKLYEEIDEILNS